jgi:uncharacterized protein
MKTETNKRANNVNVYSVIKEKRAEILVIAGKYGGSNLRVYKHILEDKLSEDGFIDFIIDLEEGRSLFDLGGITHELTELLGIPVVAITAKGIIQNNRAYQLKDTVEI